MHLDGEDEMSRPAQNGPSTDAAIRDRGGVLILVLVTGVIATMFVLPILYYVTTVTRANRVTSNKAEAVELAEGGTWVALNNQGELFELCVGGELNSSLDDVTTTCEVLAIESLRDLSEIPFDAAAIQADQPLPAGVGANPYSNPNTAANPAAWLTSPDWTAQTTAGAVWLPQLPVRPAGAGSERDKMLVNGAEDGDYDSCRVFFPGTFTDPIDIAEPTYFVSGVYYFTQPITLRAGADVVVGPGSEIGCTNEFTALSNVVGGPPIPLGTSGYGSTFVLGDAASILIDDDGSDKVRFAMNPRYVGADETSYLASAGVSIMSVNGDHASPALTVPADLNVPGVIAVPASTVGVDGSPFAADRGYSPSVLTPKPAPPSVPTITSAMSYQRDRSGDAGPLDRGRVTVFWDAPADNGSTISGYTATDSVSGRSCSPAAQPGFEIQTSCTIDGLTNQTEASGQHPTLTVTATNDVGVSVPSDPFDADRVDLEDSTQVPSASVPDSPQNVAAVDHPDGVAATWDAVSGDGGSPITGYRVVVVASGVDGGTSSCTARWNETACVAPVPTPPTTPDPDPGAAKYTIDVMALQSEGAPAVEFVGVAEDVDSGDFSTSTDPAPVLTPAPLPGSAPRKAILDFSVENSADVIVSIGGYVSVPEGRIALSSASPSSSSISMSGGLLAGVVDIDPGGAPALDVRFDNPIGQKRIRLVSTSAGRISATSTAIVQVNESGSLAINSWIVQ